VCPSCNARRMCGTAAHLTDAVIPDVPLRQWVLSVPFELRLLLARDPRALTAVGRICARDLPLAARTRRAVRTSLYSKWSRVFPSAIWRQHELERSFHVAVPDGVFTAAKGATRAEFWRLPTPDRLDVETLTVNVEMRVVSWLRDHGFSITTETRHPPSRLLAQRSMPAWRARSAWATCPPCRAGEAPPATVTMRCLRQPDHGGAVATCEASTCMRGWSCLQAPAARTAAAPLHRNRLPQRRTASRRCRARPRRASSFPDDCLQDPGRTVNFPRRGARGARPAPSSASLVLRAQGESHGRASCSSGASAGR
jgi:hypothetical protein